MCFREERYPMMISISQGFMQRLWIMPEGMPLEAIDMNNKKGGVE